MDDTFASLAGSYRLRPGRSPAIAGRRPVLEGGRLADLLRGAPAAQAPEACAAVFTLCSQAHRRTSEAAIGAARGDPLPPADPALLHFETARDHLRAIALDWPARAGIAPDVAWLQDAPLRIAGPSLHDAAAARAALGAFGEWLAGGALHMQPDAWLRCCQDPEGLRAWSADAAAALPPAGLLRSWHAPAHRMHLDGHPLHLLEDDAARQEAQLRELAHALAAEPGFAQFPHWHGTARENGPWARLRHAGRPPVFSAWTRLAARWVELVELAAAEAPPLLAQGALALAAGEALAWCEMARGLLFHWVRLDGGGRVQDYRVLAPTEWNFHPRGSLARALERLDPGDTASAALLGAAFDACVPCSIEAGD